KRPNGSLIPPKSPTLTSVPSTPESIRRWIETIRKADAASGRRSVDQYILDNETALWHETHRDVHPEPTTYDELLEKTIAYATAIRAADPDAVIAGPAAWGWPEYFYSAKDSAIGLRLRPDRRLHGDVPLLAWWLQKLREHDQKTGTQLVNVVDVHFYPQAKNVFGDANDPGTAALRLRQTRGLWDPTYVDESWINDTIMLLPRLKRWIDEDYPGRKVSIGEYNFGGESHMSGALAEAEALGRFGQEGVSAAFYWTYPKADSPVVMAFRAYRNFDGKGGRFLDYSVPTGTTLSRDFVSAFASRDADGTHMVLVLLNLSPDSAAQAKVRLDGCGPVKTEEAYSYAGGPVSHGLAQQPPSTGGSAATLEPTLPAYSITVLDIRLQHAAPGRVEK
ncbi:MAG TPA: glycoside hydrolase family 44 protein, partial [Polyangiaceae bacterium]